MGHDPMARKGAGKCIHVHFLLCVHRRRSDPQSVRSTSESPSPAAASLLPSAADDLCRIHIHVDASLWVYIIHVRGCGREAPRRTAGEIPRRDPCAGEPAVPARLRCCASSLGTPLRPLRCAADPPSRSPPPASCACRLAARRAPTTYIIRPYETTTVVVPALQQDRFCFLMAVSLDSHHLI